MKKIDKPTTQNLRQKAEELLNKRTAKTPLTISEAETQKLIHELEVHKIELELQNEELLMAKEQAETSSDKYKDLYDFAPSGYLTLSKDGEILEINLSCAKMLGKERLYLKNKHFQLFVAHDTKPIFNLFFEKVFSSNAKETCEIAVKTNDNNASIYVYLSAIASENREQCIVTVIDITERKIAEASLKASEEQFRAVSEYSFNSICIINEIGKIIWANESMFKMGGYSKEQIYNADSFAAFIAPQSLEFVVSNFTKFVKREEYVHHYEFYFIRSDGQIRLCEKYMSHFIDKNGKQNLVISMLDITEQKQIENELAQSEHRFRTIFEQAAVGVALLNTKTGQFIQINQKYCDFVGYTPEEMLQKTFVDITHPSDVQTNIDRNNALILNHNKDFSFEKRYIHKNGEVLWGNITTSPIWKPNENPQTYYHIAIVEDITKRKQIEKNLIALNSRLELAMQSANMSWWEMDFTTGNVSFEKQKAEMLGYSSENFKHYKDFMALVHPEDYDRTMNAMHIHLEGKCDKYEIEYRILTNAGEYKWFYDIGSIAKRDANGKPLSITGLVIDITKRKKIEFALQEKQEIFNKFMEHSPIYVFFKDENMRTISLSKNYETMLGKPLHELIGKSMHELFPSELAKKIMKDDSLILKDDKEIVTEEKLNGRFYTTIKFPIHIANKPSYLAGYTIDITERKKNEKEILELNETLEQKVKIRTTQLEAAYSEMEAFSYSVSHDLRAPLRAIDGFSQVLLNDFNDLDTEAIRLINIICQSSKNMGKLIDDLLSFSRIGRTNLALTPINMNELVQSVLIQIKKVVILNNTPINTLVLHDAMGDKTLLNQIWTNLISNAIKFSSKVENPIIDIGCYKEASEVVYYVKDNGVGFDMNYINKLFGVFQRLHSASEFEGTGIGLAIVRKAVTRQGGRIWAESAEGKGASFYFTLPIR